MIHALHHIFAVCIFGQRKFTHEMSFGEIVRGHGHIDWSTMVSVASMIIANVHVLIVTSRHFFSFIWFIDGDDDEAPPLNLVTNFTSAPDKKLFGPVNTLNNRMFVVWETEFFNSIKSQNWNSRAEWTKKKRFRWSLIYGALGHQATRQSIIGAHR